LRLAREGRCGWQGKAVAAGKKKTPGKRCRGFAVVLYGGPEDQYRKLRWIRKIADKAS